MRKMVLMFFLCSALAGAACADVVFMKNGKIHRGEATRQGDTVLIKGPLATISVKAEDVERIVESKPPTDGIVPPPIEPVFPLGVPRTGPEKYLRPESHVFYAMRQLVGSPGGMEAYELRGQIKSWREKTHDRQRKFQSKWVTSLEMQRAREEFAAVLLKAKDLQARIRRAGSTTASGRATQAKYRRGLGTHFRQAAQIWPDQLMRDFLTGVAHFESLNYTGAIQMFDQCIATAPRVAAFWQGKALALSAKGQKIEALAAFLSLLHVQPDLKEAYYMVQGALQEVPGTMMTDATFVTAKRIMEIYEEPPTKPYSRPGTTWLMPGRPWMTYDFTLPTPPYDRLVFRQAVGIPVGKKGLLVDKSVLDGALEAFVVIDHKTTVAAQIQRTSTYGTKQPPLGLITVQDFEFTPLTIGATASIAKELPVTLHGLSVYEEMGSQLRRVSATIEDVGAEGALSFSRKLLPGETVSPVIAKDRQLIGFVSGKTDPMADGGGPDLFVPLELAENLIKQANRTTTYYGSYSRVKRKIVPKPAQGDYFVVLITAAEASGDKRL